MCLYTLIRHFPFQVIFLEIIHYASLILQLLLPLDTCDIGDSLLAIGNHHYAEVFSNHQI